MWRRLAAALSAGALLLALPVASAWAYGYTTVVDPPQGEASHLEIISTIYTAHGGTWSPSGLDFVNDGGITATRVYDYDNDDEILHIFLGDASDVDQIWTDGDITVTAQVKWAGNDQSFGWNQGEGVDGLATNYYELLTDADIGGDPVEISIAGNFLWGAQPDNGGTPEEWWSKQSLNGDSEDHMVTYYVTGLPDAEGAAVWLLFWEDMPCWGCDADFNDFVIEARAIPEPGTLLLVGAGLVGLAAFRRRHPRV